MRCLTPFWIEEYQAMVPCGKCPACYTRRVSQWSFRLMQEYDQCNSAYFVTLTYEPETVPYTEDGKKTLSKRDIQLFIKKLRQWQRRRETKLFKQKKIATINRVYSKIKYYLVGEYGTRTRRPHYHMIIFNATVEAIEANWDKGQIQYGTVTTASVGYTLKYMSKTSTIGKHYLDSRTPQFALMSLGLGASYLTPKMISWHKAALAKRCFVRTKEGLKISMPRYYKIKIYDEIEKEKIANEMQLQAFEKILHQAWVDADYHEELRTHKENVNAAYNRMHYRNRQLQKI